MLASLYSSVRTGACLCAHRETSASDPETIPAAGGDTAYLSCFAVVPSHLGNCLSARVCGYVFQKHAPSTSQRYEQRRPWVGTTLTPFGAVSACSPSGHPLPPSPCLEIHRDDSSRSPQLQHAKEEPQVRERAPPPQGQEQRARVYWSIRSPSGREHLQGLVTPSTLRTPRRPADGRAEEEADTEASSQREGRVPDALYWQGRLRNTLGLSWGRRQALKKRLFPFLWGR